MRATFQLIALQLLLLACTNSEHSGTAGVDAESEAKDLYSKVELGMTREQLLEILGPPILVLNNEGIAVEEKLGNLTIPPSMSRSTESREVLSPEEREDLRATLWIFLLQDLPTPEPTAIVEITLDSKLEYVLKKSYVSHAEIEKILQNGRPRSSVDSLKEE